MEIEVDPNIAPDRGAETDEMNASMARAKSVAKKISTILAQTLGDKELPLLQAHCMLFIAGALRQEWTREMAVKTLDLTYEYLSKGKISACDCPRCTGEGKEYVHHAKELGLTDDDVSELETVMKTIFLRRLLANFRQSKPEDKT